MQIYPKLSFGSFRTLFHSPKKLKLFLSWLLIFIVWGGNQINKSQFEIFNFRLSYKQISCQLNFLIILFFLGNNFFLDLINVLIWLWVIVISMWINGIPVFVLVNENLFGRFFIGIGLVWVTDNSSPKCNLSVISWKWNTYWKFFERYNYLSGINGIQVFYLRNGWLSS